MSDEELIAELRKPWFTNGCERYQLDAADRIEALVRERDQWIVRCGRERAFASSHRIRAERLEAAGKAYREATRHLKPCPETAAGFDAALKGDDHV
jgi:hypothetical protein